METVSGTTPEVATKVPLDVIWPVVAFMRSPATAGESEYVYGAVPDEAVTGVKAATVCPTISCLLETATVAFTEGGGGGTAEKHPLLTGLQFC